MDFSGDHGQLYIKKTLMESKYTKVNCSSCNTELMIRIAKGDNGPERVLCKACSQETLQNKVIKLTESQKNKWRKTDRAIKKRHNWTLSHKNDPTSRQEASRKRIYGSSS